MATDGRPKTVADDDGMVIVSSVILSLPQRFILAHDRVLMLAISSLPLGVGRDLKLTDQRAGEVDAGFKLLDPNGTEHVPDGKRDRSCQLYRFGFT